MKTHNVEESFANLDVFLAALAEYEDILENLSHVCQSLERNDWDKIDNTNSVQLGYKLIEGCVHNSKIFQKCIKAIGTALQMQTFYGYEFYTKEIKDFGRVYRFILPTQDILDHKGPPSGLAYCENALYACRLFDRLLHKGIKNGEFFKAFQARFQELLTQTIISQQDSVEQTIRKLYPGIDLLPFIEKESMVEDDVNSEMSDITTPDVTDAETLTNSSPSLSLLEPIANQDISTIPVEHWLYLEDDMLLDTCMLAYRLFEINGISTSRQTIQAKELIEACSTNKEVLYRCLSTIEHVLRYLDEHHFQYQKKYYTHLGYVYTLKDYPMLTFEAGEGALCAGELFTKMYENGYQNPSAKESFRKTMHEIIKTCDFTKQFPYFYASFGQKININVSTSHNKENKLKHTVQQTISEQPNSSFWYIVLPTMLTFLNLLIQKIQPESQPPHFNIESNQNDTRMSSRFN